MAAGASERTRGRRPGPTETREQILDCARRLFADKGYDGASLRAIAREAGVDPALVHHFFGTKQGVFIAAMNLPLDPAAVVARLRDVPSRRELGAALAETFLGVWEDPERRIPMLALVRSAMTNEQVATMLRQFIAATLLGPLAERFGIAPIRMEAAAGQLVGVAMLRYVLGLEPIASATAQELVELLAPALQRHFDGD
ncbi:MULTISPECIES: TetR/AcrR family transcriptional regulator [Thermomonospora]|uniref:Transcriptional regulator, TetR family n=1 Tax=Thermomonospora curvata (strain ATCC 19995 / DSM 43183 / JCM 3096 / KCTC 9072 / NBRC 15933 / NCIMB 10081 / Henssen B9) TaxID=471852 RepID=D1A4B6_THECD|nr:MULTISPECIES: TetR family transcriptional regulator [Thermomonospora]ACY99990.1 transcriptional regulator, TetR family [Thermomonospora curvata DSM 43183]PKK12210.1 MAG: TetR/AcrR family transcriptional regulator [Thermomonospora sp. CIF 1]